MHQIIGSVPVRGKGKKKLKIRDKNIFNKAIIRKFKKKNEERLTKGETDV